MYKYEVRSIPITNIKNGEKEILIKQDSIKIIYGTMAKPSSRIDDDIFDKILDCGTEAIKVYRYIKSHTNSQNNKVIIKGSEVVDYFKSINKKCTLAEVSNGKKALVKINFIIPSNSLEIYKNDKFNEYLVNPNYYVKSSVDAIFSKIKNDENIQADYERIRREDEQRKELSNSTVKLKLKKKNDRSKTC